jgi:NADH-quinone oxidoreductase subunit G
MEEWNIGFKNFNCPPIIPIFHSSNIPCFFLGEFMPKLKIDGLEVEVPKGMKVIEAAERLGIIIPRFCYHAALGSVGACRMCAVKFLEGPVKGVQMSCMVDTQDGMVVSTTDEEAVDFRKHVIEWLMMNHPHDCPVCDEGGHCLLQDMTVSGGHGIRRYLGKKRTFRDQYLGVFVQHEMNRCIHCWRCRRFYQEFAGYRDLGAMQIAYRTYFGRYKDGPLESPFSGNLIDLCPTGVYTDKPSRFKGRRWDYERSPSLCIHCSLGDRGRYGFYYTNHPERPRRPRINGGEVSWEKVIQTAAQELSQIKQSSGSQSIDCLGSSRSCLENQAMLRRLCQSFGLITPAFHENSSIARKLRSAVTRLDKNLTISMRDIEEADFILVVGADPINEAPMLTLALRQAYRKGATITVVDPRPVLLPFEFLHLSVVPQEIDLTMSTLIKNAVNRSTGEKIGKSALQFYESIPTNSPLRPELKERFNTIIQMLHESRFPVIICGTDIVLETTPALAADHALLLQAEKGRAGLFYVMPGANSFGAPLFSEGRSFVDSIESIEHGKVKALMIVESDPFHFFPDQERLKKAIEKLDFLIVMDCLPSQAMRYARIVMPTRTPFEMDAAFINQEGRIQFLPTAHCGGIPIEQISGGGHPPRVFRSDIPGNEPKAAWQILAELSDALTLPGDWKSMTRDHLWQWMAQENPIFANVVDGIRVYPKRDEENLFSTTRLNQKGRDRMDGQLELLLVDWTFETEELSAFSKFIRQVEKEPFLLMHPEDAMKAGLKDKDRVTLHLDGGPLEIKVSIAENMASGIMVLPRHHQLKWQKLKTFPVRIPFERIKKV